MFYYNFFDGSTAKSARRIYYKLLATRTLISMTPRRLQFRQPTAEEIAANTSLICNCSFFCVKVHGMLSWIALNMVEGLKSIHRAALIRAFGSAENVFRQTEMDLLSVPEMKTEFAHRILHFDFQNAEKEVALAKRSGFALLTLEQDSYPEMLRTIPDPPLVLYVRGELSSDQIPVALVGSRKATPYGLNVTNALARDLAKAGITIVSGLARGVDAKAHNATLEAEGKTIAVLGSGLDVIYPSEHRMLAEKISKSGAVISEFPLGTPPNRDNFPVRNRIISGMSHLVVVVEASDKSGSLITARMASEQGREVMAVPGSIFNEQSLGCNALIKDGAGLVRSWEDVVAELPLSVANRVSSQQSESRADHLTESEKNIIALLSFEQPSHVDQIAERSGVRSQDLLGTLVNLELKNYITQIPGKNFLRIK
jgi:DNA processing protein